jgi:hypothetical protein
MPLWLTIALPLLCGVAVAMATSELKGYLLRRANEICEHATSVLPGAEASQRAEEWAAHILDMDQEPIRAFITANKYRKDARRMATELEGASARAGMLRRIANSRLVAGVMFRVRAVVLLVIRWSWRRKGERLDARDGRGRIRSGTRVVVVVGRRTYYLSNSISRSGEGGDFELGDFEDVTKWSMVEEGTKWSSQLEDDSEN